MDNRQDIEGVRRFQWIRYAGGVDNLDASIPLALGFIDSDEWELVCSDRDKGAWKRPASSPPWLSYARSE